MGQAHCRSCDQLIEFPDELNGQETACPTCGVATRLNPDVPPVRIPAQPRGSSTLPAAAASQSALVADVARNMIENIERVIIGKRQEITVAMVAYLSESHLLLEDVPGVAKTMLARAIAQSVGCSFKRIQCTPDLLPSDITGASVFSPKTADFEFRPGPIFAQIVLADEINRATPRTQSALLEAMSEGQVTC